MRNSITTILSGIFILFSIYVSLHAESDDRSIVQRDSLEWRIAAEEFGDSNGDMEDVLSGFDDETDKTGLSESIVQTESISFFNLSGLASLGASYNFAHEAPVANQADYRGLSRLKTKLDLELELKFSSKWRSIIQGKGFYDFAYLIKGKDDFTEETLDMYEDELELGEAFIQGSIFSFLDIKAGRQIIVWGKSDNIRVVDVLNPLDNREPGIVDIKDLRLPLTMTKIDLYIGDWNLTGIAVHEIRFNKDPVSGSDFYPLTLKIDEEIPANVIENTEYGAAINGIFSGWDLSMYYAFFYNDMPHIEGSFMLMERHHARLNMTGMSINIALGNWLLKTEGAYFHGLKFFTAPDEDKSRIDLMAGFEYSGFADMILSLEAVNKRLIDFNPIMEQLPDDARENEFQLIFMNKNDFLNDTLHLTILISVLGYSDKFDGRVRRFSVEYDVMDAFSVLAGVVFYRKGDRMLTENIGDKDRLFFEAKYSF